MAATYGEYTRDRVGMFFGVTGGQLVTLVLSAAPALWAFHQEKWGLVAGFALAWALVLALVVVPIRGRSATGWLVASLAYASGAVLRWTRWRSKASRARPTTWPSRICLASSPGSLFMTGRRRDRRMSGSRSSRITPAGSGRRPPRSPTPAWRWPMAPNETARAAVLATLLNACARTELVSEVLFMVRSVPDDGAEQAAIIGPAPAGRRAPAWRARSTSRWPPR